MLQSQNELLQNQLSDTRHETQALREQSEQYRNVLINITNQSYQRFAPFHIELASSRKEVGRLTQIIESLLIDLERLKKDSAPMDVIGEVSKSEIPRSLLNKVTNAEDEHRNLFESQHPFDMDSSNSSSNIPSSSTSHESSIRISDKTEKTHFTFSSDCSLKNCTESVPLDSFSTFGSGRLQDSQALGSSSNCRSALSEATPESFSAPQSV